MIDIRNGKVILGEGDVKVGFTTDTILFGRPEVPDNEEKIYECYDFGIVFSLTEIIEFHKELTKIANDENAELKYIANDITVEFKTRKDIEWFMNRVLAWGAALVTDAFKLAEYIQNVGVGANGKS